MLDDTETTQEEITLDTAEGLYQFSDHVVGQHDELAAFTEEAKKHHALQQVLDKGMEAYRELVKVIQAGFVTFDNGGSLSPVQVETIQTQYDKLIEAVAAAEEITDEIANTVPTKKVPLQAMLPERELGQDAILSEKVRNNPIYKEIIQTVFNTPGAFEASLRRLVRQVEEPSKLDMVFKVKHGSIFTEILKGMTVSEVSYFNSLSGEQIREALAEMEVEDKLRYEYRIYDLWMKEFAFMVQLVRPPENMLFEDLLAISELERFREE